MTRLEYLTAGKEESLLTDHSNLVFIFESFGSSPGIARHTANKLMRSALKLSGYRYVFEHLPGNRNVWAYILTRWAVKPNNAVKRPLLAQLMVAPISPSLSEMFDSPCRKEFIMLQKKSTEMPSKKFSEINGLYQDSKSIVWIPDKGSTDMQRRILIDSHTGMGGHRGTAPTLDVLRSHFELNGMEGDLEQFCESCLHCLSTSTGNTVPRPLGHALHAEKPNQILLFYFCYIGKVRVGWCMPSFSNTISALTYVCFSLSPLRPRQWLMH